MQVSAAACACIQSLSGSMKCLRSIPMAELMPPMLRLLLLQPEPELQHSALKALSNLVLDTASAKVMTNPPVDVPLGAEEFLPPAV